MPSFTAALPALGLDRGQEVRELFFCSSSSFSSSSRLSQDVDQPCSGQAWGRTPPTRALQPGQETLGCSHSCYIYICVSECANQCIILHVYLGFKDRFFFFQSPHHVILVLLIDGAVNPPTCFLKPVLSFLRCLRLVVLTQTLAPKGDFECRGAALVASRGDLTPTFMIRMANVR